MRRRDISCPSSLVDKFKGVKWYNLTVLGGGCLPGFAICICDCGEEIEVPITKFSSGRIKSCGCEVKISAENKAIIEKLWKTACGMIGRCKNRSDKNYGGRGIRVCEDWLDSKILFVDWALKNGYKPGLSLDRIDVNGNYEPSNCRWADSKTQANNKRDTIYVHGTPLSIYCQINGKNEKRTRSRIEHGWGYDEAMNKPVNSTSKVYEDKAYSWYTKYTPEEISKYFLEV